GIQQANTAGLEKTDQMEAGLKQPVKLEGPADKNHNPFNERVDPAKAVEPAPIAPPVVAPIQQIAPVSANGEKTSARTSMQSDAPENIVQASQPGTNEVPTAQEASPPVVPGPSDPVEQPEVKEKPFEQMDALEQADNLLFQIPGRQRFY
ncbi:MAG: hypothetical protein NTW30_06245, partial [Candidatus Aenigmarchaeota archaeon]|nr:hypothetical protein [Candidatus Aenigmarchaeota archaeon]